jgi:ATP phosphoribosyltransferase regulatory subunit
MQPALLPSGLQDLLPPDAAREQRMITELLACFAANGYQQVTPPLVEFEETLLGGKGAAYAPQTFRVPDPLSQKMMGLRADITTQIARIAATLLAKAPKPLRLSYAGRVLRTLPQGLSPERQLVQSGLEVIGVDAPAALSEVLLVSIEALGRVGSTQIVADLTLAGLLDELLVDVTFESDEARAHVIAAVKRKDPAALPETLPVKDTILALLSLPLEAAATLKALHGLALPARVKGWLAQLAEVHATLQREAPQVRLTIDPLESHGFEYQEGLCFSLFDGAHGREVGRGGRYVIQDGLIACGATLYVRALLECGYLPVTQERRLLLAPGTTEQEARRLREQGYVTLRALGKDWQEEARTLGCTHVWEGGSLREL